MSLETAIRENTAALAALTAALSVQLPAASTQRGQTPSVDTPAVAQEKNVPTPTLDYERDVKPSVLRAAAKDKPAVKAILAKFGVERGPAVPTPELPMFLALIEEVLANG